MKKLLFPFFIVCSILIFESCKSKEAIIEIPTKEVHLDTIVIDSDNQPVYNPSRKRENDLQHTKLEVYFDWDSTYLYGKANLIFTPYFYPTAQLVLDAKGFQLHEVAMVDSIGAKQSLVYAYDGEKIKISLGKTYHRTDTYEIFIDYTAMPNKLKESGSAAISSEKGLFFINPDGSEAGKPRQIWTQGETESSSCWFPTIDAPNERTTQEIYITVDTAYKTLSNGTLMFQMDNGDGSRTDFWKQDKPHAPYLFMMAVGDFAEIKDQWRGMPVHYFVEPKYADIAKEIYPNTVEMLEFFSTILDYDYPWDKLHQIVVRDYVSGAMENTGAVVFGDFIQGDKRFLIDNSGEDIVAHELIHHWFGNLVTCESWSNLPLNEAFATYGEYLWFEHKYGKDRADYHGYNDMRIYFQTAQMSKQKMIRFEYKNQMEMFDATTYQKGGRVLHMLRTYVGDDAFFTALNYYLKENEYQAVEIHNLRLAFEKITGEDLNWFFNQWFLSAGHPVLKVSKEFIDSTNTLELTVEQTQDGEDVPAIFKLPTTVEIVKANGEIELKEIVIDKRKNTFSFSYNKAPLLVNLDADKSMLAEIDQHFSIEEAAVLYRKGENYLDRYNAIRLLKRKKDSLSNIVKTAALSDRFWHVRESAIEGIESLVEENPTKSREKLISMAIGDSKSDVRAKAIASLSKYFSDDIETSLFRNATVDSSYLVVSSAIKALYKKDQLEGLKAAKTLENIDNDKIQMGIADIYTEDGSAEHLSYFQTQLKSLSGFGSYVVSMKFGDFLENQDAAVVNEALPTLEELAINKEIWWMRMGALSSIVQLNDRFKNAMKEQEKLFDKENPEKTKATVKEAFAENESMYEKTQTALKSIREVESNSNLLRMLKSNIDE